MKVVCRGHVLADKVSPAYSFYRRFMGLMGQASLERGEGLLLKTTSVHCLFMKLTIDAIYLSENLTVIGKETLAPWHIGKWHRGTKYVLELNSGAAADVSAGDHIILVD